MALEGESPRWGGHERQATDGGRTECSLVNLERNRRANRPGAPTAAAAQPGCVPEPATGKARPSQPTHRAAKRRTRDEGEGSSLGSAYTHHVCDMLCVWSRWYVPRVCVRGCRGTNSVQPQASLPQR